MSHISCLFLLSTFYCHLSNVSRLLSIVSVSCLMFLSHISYPVSHLLSLVSRHVSYLTSLVSRLTSPVSLIKMSPVSCFLIIISCLLPPVSCLYLLSLLSCLLSQIFCLLSHKSVPFQETRKRRRGTLLCSKTADELHFCVVKPLMSYTSV